MRLSLCVKVLIQQRVLLLKCWDLRLSLSLKLSTHWITATKLAMKSHRLRVPSEVPHRFRDVGQAAREHGTSVRLGKIKHQKKTNSPVMHPHDVQHSCSGSKAPPFSSHNPIYGCQCSDELRAQLNLTNDQKERVTIPASMTCAWKIHVAVVCQALEQWWKGKLLSQLTATKPCARAIPQDSGQLFNTHSTDWWEAEKWPAVALLLKNKFGHQVVASTFCLEKHSPKDSCHLDESSMNHTLAQKYLIELLMWNASHVQKLFSFKPDRRNWLIRSERLHGASLATAMQRPCRPLHEIGPK